MGICGSAGTTSYYYGDLDEIAWYYSTSHNRTEEWARKHLMRGDYMMFLAMCVSGLMTSTVPLIMRIIANQVVGSSGSLEWLAAGSSRRRV